VCILAGIGPTQDLFTALDTLALLGLSGLTHSDQNQEAMFEKEILLTASMPIANSPT
jgi:hypothetical protein